MTYIQQGGLMEQFITHLGMNVTGEYFLPVLMIVLFIILVAIGSQIPMEWTAVLVLPVLITGMAYDSNWGTYLTVIIIYLAALVSKIWFLNR